jgi:hypothetical protein
MKTKDTCLALEIIDQIFDEIRFIVVEMLIDLAFGVYVLDKTP